MTERQDSRILPFLFLYVMFGRISKSCRTPGYFSPLVNISIASEVSPTDEKPPS